MEPPKHEEEPEVKPAAAAAEDAKHNEIVNITNLQHLLDLKAKHPGVIVDYFANWCPPCLEFKPKFIEMCKNNKNTNLIFCMV
jgi:thiol-disulfide isomerase/thioredoxin